MNALSLDPLDRHRPESPRETKRARSARAIVGLLLAFVMKLFLGLPAWAAEPTDSTAVSITLARADLGNGTLAIRGSNFDRGPLSSTDQ